MQSKEAVINSRVEEARSQKFVAVKKKKGGWEVGLALRERQGAGETECGTYMRSCHRMPFSK
jgi:hypothetical protein